MKNYSYSAENAFIVILLFILFFNMINAFVDSRSNYKSIILIMIVIADVMIIII